MRDAEDHELRDWAFGSRTSDVPSSGRACALHGGRRHDPKLVSRGGGRELRADTRGRFQLSSYKIARRAFLRGSGAVALLGPLLRNIEAFAQTGQAPKRFLVIHHPIG